jgi:Zn-dependent protease/CBS domain-containing protein
MERMTGSRGIHIGNIWRIPITLDWSWFLVLVLATWSLAMGYFPTEYPRWPMPLYWLLGVVTTIMLFISVLLHELGHAFVARAFDIPVQRITLFIFGGVAQLGAESRTAKSEFLVASVGPAVSFALAGFCLGVRLIVTPGQPAFALFDYLTVINFMLGAFNLIPGFPLDGGRVLRAILWGLTRSMSKATLWAVRVGQIVAFGFMVLGCWRVLNGAIANGLWIAFVGWFLRQAADAQLTHQVMRDVLSDYTVGQAMNRDYVTVPGDIAIQQLVDEHILAQGRRSVVVKSNGHVEGLLTVHHVKDIPREKWPEIRVIEAMAPEDCCEKVAHDSGLWDALEKMDRSGFNQLLVSRDGEVVGMLNRGDVITFLRTVQELEI